VKKKKPKISNVPRIVETKSDDRFDTTHRGLSSPSKMRKSQMIEKERQRRPKHQDALSTQDDQDWGYPPLNAKAYYGMNETAKRSSVLKRKQQISKSRTPAAPNQALKKTYSKKKVDRLGRISRAVLFFVPLCVLV